MKEELPEQPAPKLYTVGPYVYRQDNVTAKLSVRPDVTAAEGVALALMFSYTSASMLTGQQFEWLTFIQNEKLNRHFEINIETHPQGP